MLLVVKVAFAILSESRTVRLSLQRKLFRLLKNLTH